MLTRKEKKLICRAAADIKTGNHLLYKRTNEELEMLKGLCSVLETVENKTKLTPREYQIYHEYLMCTDYRYYQLIKKLQKKR